MNANILWVAVVAYLFGAIPFGVLVARTYRVDIQKVGSGNIGTANVLRSVGWGAAAVTALADIFKGGFPMLIAQALGMPGWELAVVGFLAIIGHNYSVFLGFKGGKGVATSYGTVTLIDPLLGLAILPMFVATVAITRYSSAASILASFSGIMFAITMQREWWKIVMLILIFMLILWQHRDNLTRLATGTERQFNQKSTSLSDTAKITTEETKA